jgi:amidohydrolase
MDVKALADQVRGYMLDMRHEFHRYPELSKEEFRTSCRIKEELDAMGVDYISVGDTTGILAEIKGGKPGKTILLRCDMDALKVTEEADVDFKSEHDGVMHACGHDGHMAMMLASIKAVKMIQADICGTVKFLFQPAEEIGKGGIWMMENNVMDGVDGCFGEHLWAGMPVGKISVEAGPRMSSCGFFDIRVKGKASHGAMPHEGIDTIVASSAIVMNLQTIVSRETSPLDNAVVTIGCMQAGTQGNIIAEDAVLSGTTRTYQMGVREKFEERIRRIAETTAETFNATATLTYRDEVAPVINDPVCSARAEKAVVKLFGEEAVYPFPPQMGAEDFSIYLNAAPLKGCMAFVGAGNPEIGANWPHHHSKFKIDEEGMYNGLLLYLQYTLDWLEEYKND